MKSGRPPVAAILATIAVTLTVVAGLITLGPPSVAREHRLDEQRTLDLVRITTAIDGYAKRQNALPPSLDTLVATHDLALIPRDPTTNTPYEYGPTGPSTYRLCATFQQPSDGNVAKWNHSAGHTCFDDKLRHSTPSPD